MASLLDIHKYSKQAFQLLYDKLSSDDFKRDYITREDPIASVTGIIWDITQQEPELKSIIESMDKIDNIKAENSKSKLEKITHTWLKKAYREHFENGYNISRTMFLKFLKNVLKPNSKKSEDKLIAAGTNLYNKIYSSYKMRQSRIKDTDKLNDLKQKFPNLDIDCAFRYAVVTGKFNLNIDDIEDFECIVKILTKQTTN